MAKVALHAAVGASISGLTGGSVAGGALSAGASEAASPLTAGQTKLVQELASTVIGAAGASIGGGSATAGGATALAGQQYNRELHPDELAALKAYQEGKTPEEREAAAMVACKLLNCFVTGTADGSEAKPDTYNADLKIAVDQWVAANPEAYAKIAADLGKTGLFTSTAAETKADAAVINWAETKGGGWKALQADQLAIAQTSGRLTPDIQTQIVTTAQQELGNGYVAITDEERRMAELGDLDGFWKSRKSHEDPIGALGVQFGGGSKGLGVILSETKLDAVLFSKHDDSLASRYPSSMYGIATEGERSVSANALDEMRAEKLEIRVDLMRAHVAAVDADGIGKPHFLSADQIADYHRQVFQRHGLPASTFGGTPLTGAPFEVIVFRGIWCGECERPK